MTLSILKEFGFGKDIIEERIQTEVSALLQQVRDAKSATFSPDTAVTLRVLNVIVSIVFGHRMDDRAIGELGEVLRGYLDSGMKLMLLEVFSLFRFLPNMRRNIAIATACHNQLFRSIVSGIETADEDSFVRYYASREGCKLDREQLEFIVRDLIMAGTETSSTTLLWAIVLLVGPGGQSVQERMWKEIDSQVPCDRLPSLADRSQMPFVEAIILEVMRIRTVVPLSVQHCTSQDTTAGGYFIPANTMASNSHTVSFIILKLSNFIVMSIKIAQASL